MIFHRTPINYLLVNLAIADALYATFVTPQTFFKITPTHPGGTTGTVLCKLVTSGNLAWIAVNSSVITLVAIATERYYAVIHPLAYKFNKGKLKVNHSQNQLTLAVYIKPADSFFMHSHWLLKLGQGRNTQAFMERVSRQNASFDFNRNIRRHSRSL